MLGSDGCVRKTIDGSVGWAFLHDSFLSGTARNSTKTGRSQVMEQLIIHAHPEWTAEHWENEADKVAELMLAEFWRVAGVEPKQPVHLQAHRWKYAIPGDPAGKRCFSNKSAAVIACGDWASGSRVEGAFLERNVSRRANSWNASACRRSTLSLIAIF